MGKRRKGEIEEEAAIRWAADKKKDWGKEEEIEMDYHKIEGMVPRRFHRWMKVFGKVESERMPVRKVWDHAIDLRYHAFHQVVTPPPHVRICQRSASRSHSMSE